MLASYNWLKEYTDTKKSPAELTELFTATGLEVVATNEVNSPIKNLFIAEVTKKEQHPNADRLSLVTVKYKLGTTTVICGAKNVAVGQKVFLAAEGAILPGNFEIKKTTIREIESRGMICSKEELGLEEKSDGIWELPKKTDVNDNPKIILGEPDVIFDIDLTSNRGDCQSIMGIARELSAITNEYFRHKDIKKYPNKTGNIKVNLIDKTKCPRYCARLLTKVKIAPSPDWLVTRLHHHNIRSINNVVDITNLVLLEYGQPLHAFDYQKLAGKQIIIRTAEKNEKMTTLDGEEHTLDCEDLLICDADKPVALAGIMGGENSGIDKNSTEVLIESANFDPITIRKTSKKTRLSSDSSIRFEKGVDINRTIEALNYCVELIKNIAGGEVISSVIDIYPKKIQDKEVFLKFSNIKKYLGIEIKTNKVTQILTNLGLVNKYQDSEKVKYAIPSSRSDLNYEWDLIEEIGRIYGYDKIPETIPYISNSDFSIEAISESPYINNATALGYNQVVNFSFVDPTFIKNISLTDGDIVKTANPLNQDSAFMRPNLLSGILKNIKTNIDHAVKEQNKIFEIGKVFNRKEGSIVESKSLALCGFGTCENGNWITPERGYDFHDLSGDISSLLQNLGYLNIKLKPVDTPFMTKNFSCHVFINDKNIGYIGKIKNKLLKSFDIKQRDVFFGELNIDLILTCNKNKITYTPFSSYPSVYRDIALVTDKEYDIAPIAELINNFSEEVINVTISNVYHGEKIAENKKSVLFSVEYCSGEKTLAKEDVDSLEKQICDKILNVHQVELR